MFALLFTFVTSLNFPASVSVTGVDDSGPLPHYTENPEATFSCSPSHTKMALPTFFSDSDRHVGCPNLNVRELEMQGDEFIAHKAAISSHTRHNRLVTGMLSNETQKYMQFYNNTYLG